MKKSLILVVLLPALCFAQKKQPDTTQMKRLNDSIPLVSIRDILSFPESFDKTKLTAHDFEMIKSAFIELAKAAAKREGFHD